MSASKRQIRKAAQKLFNDSFNSADYEYDRMARPGRGRSRLAGIVVASVIYFVGYGAAYTGYGKGLVSDVTLGKLAWLFIIPAAVVGSIVWMVMDSRSEYELRRRIAERIQERERDGGMLWRFGPLVADATLKGVNIEEALSLSKAGEGARIDPQDYSRLVVYLRDALDGGDAVLGGDRAAQLAVNLGLE